MKEPILFYDGECGLCDWSVRWCLARDRHRLLRYAPLHGKTALATVPQAHEVGDTILLLDGDGLHARSEAVLRVLSMLGGGYRIFARIGRIIPRSVREAAYRAIAARRRRWFGGAERCLLPSAENHPRLLP